MVDFMKSKDWLSGKMKKNNSQHVFIIAEAGSNWRVGNSERDMQMAKSLIDVAVDAGADAVKFQTYRADSVYVPNAGKAKYLSNQKEKRSISDIFQDLSMPYGMIPELAGYCRKQSIEFMSTPFSVGDFEALNPFVKMHKLASYEIAHLKLIDAMVKSKKPIIMSTGAATMEEVRWSVDYFRKKSSANLILLQCTAKYPASLDMLNLNVLSTFRNEFNCDVGLSDHSRHPFIAPVTAVGLGARVIEKHFTLHNKLPGPDHPFALTPDELKLMVHSIRQAEQTLGSLNKEPVKEEIELRAFAVRSVQATKNIQKGDQLLEGVNFDVLRPGRRPKGAHPKHVAKMQGKKSKRSIKLGDGIRENDFS